MAKKANKIYNRVTAILLLIIGSGGVLVSLVHAFPIYGAIGLVPLILSVGALLMGLDKDTD
jgi:hypothetical protein